MWYGRAAHAAQPRHHTSVTSTIRICGAASAPVLGGRPKCAALREVPPAPLRSLPLGSATWRTVPSLASTRRPCHRPPPHGPPGTCRVPTRPPPPPPPPFPPPATCAPPPATPPPH